MSLGDSGPPVEAGGTADVDDVPPVRFEIPHQEDDRHDDRDHGDHDEG